MCVTEQTGSSDFHNVGLSQRSRRGAILTNGSAVGTVGGAAVGGIIGHEVSKPVSPNDDGIAMRLTDQAGTSQLLIALIPLRAGPIRSLSPPGERTAMRYK